MPTHSRPLVLLRWLGYAVSAAVVGWLLLVVLPELGDVGEAGELLLAHLGVGDVLLVAGVLVAYQVTHALTLTSVVPNLPLTVAALIRAISGGLSRVVPAGWTIGAGAVATMLRASGVPTETVGHALAVTGVWNTLTKLTLPLVGLLATVGVGTAAVPRGWSLAAVTVVSLLVTLAALWLVGREAVGRWAGRLLQAPVAAAAGRLGREPPAELPDRLMAFQDSTTEALRRRPLTVATWFYAHHLTNVALVWIGMQIAGQAAGLQTGWPELLAAFSIGYLFTGLPISPGGLGTLDVAVVAIMTALGEQAAVVSAGLVVYRVATYGLYMATLAAMPLWRRLFHARIVDWNADHSSEG